VTVFAAYYLGARLGLALTFAPNPISVLWPPNAVLLAALVIAPTKHWWAVICAALPAHMLAELQGGVPLPMVVCWFVSNVAEALIGASLVRRFTRAPMWFATLRGVLVLIAASVTGAFLSSFLDSAFVALNRWGDIGYWEAWRTRLLSNGTAALTVVPLLLSWGFAWRPSRRVATPTRVAEALLLACGLLSVSLAVFTSNRAIGAAPVLICLPLPFLLWATLRFSTLGASTAFATVAFIVIWGTGRGLSPFGAGLPHQNALAVQFFLIFLGPLLLCLAAALEERAHTQQSLLLSDRRFQLVLQATRDAVYERDIATGAVWWSRNGLDQFGYERDRYPANFASVIALAHPEDRESTMRHHATAIAGQDQSWECEFRLRRCDGSYAHVHEQGLIVRTRDGQPMQMVGAITDITERHDSDALRQRLAQASRLTAMGELAATIAHEINQPMSAILSNVDAAEMLLDAGEPGSSEIRQILKDIRDDDLRASEVIRHIRALANKHETKFERFDVNDLVRAVVRLVAPTLRLRGVRLDVRYGDVPMVNCDRILIEQVLLNLLFNGMDAMADVPESERRLEVTTARSDPGEALVSVRDHGPGISAGQRDRIFDSFFTTKPHGMGIGLSIARSLIAAHGGRIWASNHPDGGALLSFTLPAGAPAWRAPESAPAELEGT
jgi:PAS domain S-box-containing protein